MSTGAERFSGEMFNRSEGRTSALISVDCGSEASVYTLNERTTEQRLLVSKWVVEASATDIHLKRELGHRRIKKVVCGRITCARFDDVRLVVSGTGHDWARVQMFEKPGAASPVDQKSRR